MVETKPEITSTFLYAQLSARLKQQPEIIKKVAAHIKATTKYDSLAGLLNNGAEESEKREVLATCLRAVITRDFSKLREAPAEPEAPKSPKMVPVWPPAPKPQPIVVQPEQTATANTPPPVVHCSPEVSKHFGLDKMPKELVVVDRPVPFNEEQTRNLIDRLVAQEVLKAKMELLKAVDDLFEERMKKFCENVAGFVED